MSQRKRFATFQIGSHLYGDAKPSSDLDLLNLWYPTTKEMVSNQRVVIPSNVTDAIDQRNLLLGDFVMSLGANPENTLIFLQYRDWFPGLDPVWFLRTSTIRTMLVSAEGMWKNNHKAKNPSKQLAHAYRYLLGAMFMDEYLDGKSPYPLEGVYLDVYKQIRAGRLVPADFDWQWDNMLATCDEPDDERQTDEMADWVLAEYMLGPE